MQEGKKGKVERILDICSRLMEGQVINKTEEAHNYGITERSIQRDIDEIRNFLDTYTNSMGPVNRVIYDRRQKGYRLENVYMPKFSNGEILALCKVLLDSRAFSKAELELLLDKLIRCGVPRNNSKFIRNLLENKMLYYVEPQHKMPLIELMWEIRQALRAFRCIEIEYWKAEKKELVKRKLKPMAVIYSFGYFYLAAFVEDKAFQEMLDADKERYLCFYRIDRIKKLKVLDEYFHNPYANKADEGEFLKRTPFMRSGKLRKTTLRYSGGNVGDVLDRLPSAKILSEEDGVFLMEAETFGDGIDRWIKSQEGRVEKIIN